MKQNLSKVMLSVGVNPQADVADEGRKEHSRLMVFCLATIVLCCPLASAGCQNDVPGNSAESESPGVMSADTSAPPSGTVVRRLDGDADSLAIDSIFSHISTEHPPAGPIPLKNRFGGELSRYYITVGLAPGATVGEVNGLLDSIDGSISDMVHGTDVLILRIPRARDLATLQAVVERAAADPSTESAKMELVVKIPQ